jgi:3-methyladenine DNA glycosylase Tag
MDNSTEVQPEVDAGSEVVDAGQGQESSGLYDLSSIPEQFRSSVEPAFKQWEANVTKKFQEHSDYRKQWEPFEQLGVNNVDPQQMEALLAFNELATDPDQFDEWLRATAQERGLFEQQSLQDDDLFAEPAQQQFDPQQIQQMIAEQVGPLYEQAQAQQEQVAIQSAAEEIQGQLDALHEKHGDFPDEFICQLAMAYDTPDGIDRAFADYQNVIAQTERGVVENKLSEPSVPERGGQADTNAPQTNTWEDARAAAIARLRANQG